MTNDIQILTQLHYLREIPSVQREPLEPIFKDVSDVAESTLPDGEHVGDDPVSYKENQW